MNKKNSMIVAGLVIGLWMFGETAVSAQVRIFFDPPKIKVAPQDIIRDDEFTETIEEPEEESEEKVQGGALKIDVAPGEILQVPVVIADGENDVVSYALRVLYNKNVLKIIEIGGGVFPGFSAAPVTNPGAFASGKTDFTAYNPHFETTPENFQVAVISFEVIGRPKQQSTIRLRKAPRTDLVALDTFTAAKRVQVQKGIRVRVQ